MCVCVCVISCPCDRALKIESVRRPGGHMGGAGSRVLFPFVSS